MTEIIEIVNSFIKDVKKNPAVEGVTFVKAFRSNPAQVPVEGFVAVVRIENISIEDEFIGGYAGNNLKGKIYATKVALDVFSDREISGESLSDVTLKIMEAIDEADKNSMVSDMKVSPIVFDEKLNGICRKISFQLDFCLCGDEDD